MGQEFTGMVFDKKDYREDPLPKGEYESCTFKGCDFFGSDLSGCVFSECEFNGCNLSMVKLMKTAFRLSKIQRNVHLFSLTCSVEPF